MSVTKQDIIRSASKMFKEKGFQATSIQEIAQDCSIAKGSVYKYFPSKEDLMCEYSTSARRFILTGLSA